MNFAAVPAGSEGALITELEASIAKKSPLLMTLLAATLGTVGIRY